MSMICQRQFSYPKCHRHQCGGPSQFFTYSTALVFPPGCLILISASTSLLDWQFLLQKCGVQIIRIVDCQPASPWYKFTSCVLICIDRRQTASEILKAPCELHFSDLLQWSQVDGSNLCWITPTCEFRGIL